MCICMYVNSILSWLVRNELHLWLLVVLVYLLNALIISRLGQKHLLNDCHVI